MTKLRCLLSALLKFNELIFVFSQSKLSVLLYLIHRLLGQPFERPVFRRRNPFQGKTNSERFKLRPRPSDQPRLPPTLLPGRKFRRDRRRRESQLGQVDPRSGLDRVLASPHSSVQDRGCGVDACH